jgi:hypothetical protein
MIGSLCAAMLTLTPTKIAVVGATGKVGRQAVQQLVENGYIARILLRHRPDATAEPDSPAAVAARLTSLPGVETVKGDVTSTDSCNELLTGCSAVLAVHGARRTRKLQDLWRDPSDDPSHAKQINYNGVANLIAAAKASGTCRRIVRITGKGETPCAHASAARTASAAHVSPRTSLSSVRRINAQGTHHADAAALRVWAVCCSQGRSSPFCSTASDRWPKRTALRRLAPRVRLHATLALLAAPTPSQANRPVRMRALRARLYRWNYEGERLLRACPDLECARAAAASTG